MEFFFSFFFFWNDLGDQSSKCQNHNRPSIYVKDLRESWLFFTSSLHLIHENCLKVSRLAHTPSEWLCLLSAHQTIYRHKNFRGESKSLAFIQQQKWTTCCTSDSRRAAACVHLLSGLFSHEKGQSNPTANTENTYTIWVHSLITSYNTIYRGE